MRKGMIAKITFIYNTETDLTKMELSKDFSELNFVQQLDFLQDMYINTTQKYNRMLKKKVGSYNKKAKINNLNFTCFNNK